MCLDPSCSMEWNKYQSRTHTTTLEGYQVPQQIKTHWPISNPLLGSKEEGISLYLGCIHVWLRAKIHSIITSDLCSYILAWWASSTWKVERMAAPSEEKEGCKQNYQLTRWNYSHFLCTGIFMTPVFLPFANMPANISTSCNSLNELAFSWPTFSKILIHPTLWS